MSIDSAYTKDSTERFIIMLRGDIYADLNKLDLSNAMYDRAIELYPNYYGGYSAKGRNLIYLNRPEEAVSLYENALWLCPDSLKPNLYMLRGVCKQRLGDHKGAYDDFMIMHRHDSSNIDAMINLALASDFLGNNDQGMEYLQKVLKVAPDNPYANNNIGYKHLTAGQYKKALPYLNKCVALKPLSGYAYNNRGFCKLKLNDVDGALKDINYSIQLDSINAYAYKNRALVWIALKKTDAACADLKRSLELHYTRQYGNEVEELLEKHCP